MLPEGWSNRRLRFDARLNPVKSEIRLHDDDEVSFVPMDAVGELGGLRLDEIRTVDEVYTGYTYFCDDDVVVAKITPCFENGKGAYATGLHNEVAFGTTELHVIRANPNLDTRFLFYVTMADDFRSYGSAEMLGAGGQKRVPERFLKDWQTPLPAIDIQRRIAGFLDERLAQIDGLIARKLALLERLAEKRQAVITQAVTKGLNPAAPMKDSGIDWLGQIPTHWEVMPLKRLKLFLTSGSRGWGDYYADDGDVFLRMTNVTKGGVEIDDSDLRFVQLDGVNEGKRTSTQAGDILITITAELGSVAIVRDNYTGAFINQHLALFRPDNSQVDPDFLVDFLWSDVTKAQFELSGQGGTKQGLGFEQVDNVIVALPPLDEQRSIVPHINAARTRCDHLERAVSQSINRLTEYRSALITAAVTGQIEGLQ